MRAIIADDKKMCRDYLRGILAGEGVEIVAEFSDGAGVIDACLRLQPDFVILDIRMQAVQGTAVGHELLDIPNHPIVIMASGGKQAGLSQPLIEKGAIFLPKPYGDKFKSDLKKVLHGRVSASRTGHNVEAAELPPGRS